MANNVYDPNVADVVTSFSQIKTTEMTKGFAEIGDTDITTIAMQGQIAPRLVRTGELRGDQQVRGLIKVEDRNGRVVMMMGYSQGSF